MWAARPHLANIFEKLLDQKTFGCLRLVLGKPLAYGSARLGHIPSLPGNRNCPWNLVSHYHLLILKAIAILCDSLLDFTCRFLCSLICFANVGCSPTPRQHFWKTAAPKNFLFACGSYVAAYFFSTNIEKADAPFQQVFKNLWKEHPLYCFIFSECFYWHRCKNCSWIRKSASNSGWNATAVWFW